MDQFSLPFPAQIPDRKTIRHQAIAVIKLHLAQSGNKRWEVVRSGFPDIPHRTWWRWVAYAKKEVGMASLQSMSRPSWPNSVPELTGQEARRESMTRHLRIADLAGAMVGQMNNIDLLQAHAMTEDGKIKFPLLFERALRLRERQMASFVKILAPAIGQLEWSDLCDAVVDEVSKIDKDVAIKIMKALQAVQREAATN
jgi:hypothetical protein